MVCKEDVLSWFKDLDSYKRIDVLYNLLNMCLPFELRFLGSCVEEMGKHTYQEFRGLAITANDHEKLSKDSTFDGGFQDKNVRHRLALYLSLLSSRNYAAANFLYKKLSRTDFVEEIVKGHVQDEQLHSETLLLFTMALYHPAFTFEQKQYFGQVLSRLIDFSDSKNRIAPKPSMYGYPPGFGYPTTSKKSASDTSSSVPVKSASTMCYSDSTTMHQQPPGMPHLQPHSMDYIWTPRPGFHCAGAPEVPPFPTQPISPQLSQHGSPNQSRSGSPLRTSQMRPPPSQSHMSSIPVVSAAVLSAGEPMMPQQPSQQQLTIETLPLFTGELKLSEDELPLPSVLSDDELVGLRLPGQSLPPPWQSQPPQQQQQTVVPPPPPHYGLQNGLRYPPPAAAFSKPQQQQRGGLPPPLEQLHVLTLDDQLPHHSNSSAASDSGSSPNRTPPGTPSNTVAPVALSATVVPTLPHGPGRGSGASSDCKVRNGIPVVAAPLCDTTSPPPLPFNSCSGPFGGYGQFPTRYPYSIPGPYRSTFTGQYPTYTGPPPLQQGGAAAPADNGSFAFTQSIPYGSLMTVPSTYSLPFPSRSVPPGCYNCGAHSHAGADCTAQNIDEITQKKSYHLDYSPMTGDPDK